MSISRGRSPSLNQSLNANERRPVGRLFIGNYILDSLGALGRKFKGQAGWAALLLLVALVLFPIIVRWINSRPPVTSWLKPPAEFSPAGLSHNIQVVDFPIGKYSFVSTATRALEIGIRDLEFFGFGVPSTARGNDFFGAGLSFFASPVFGIFSGNHYATKYFLDYGRRSSVIGKHQLNIESSRSLSLRTVFSFFVDKNYGYGCAGSNFGQKQVSPFNGGQCIGALFSRASGDSAYSPRFPQIPTLKSADNDKAICEIDDKDIPYLRFTKKLLPPCYFIPMLFLFGCASFALLFFGLRQIQRKREFIGGCCALFGGVGLYSFCLTLVFPGIIFLRACWF